MVAEVGHIQQKVIRNGPLDTEVPTGDIGRAEIPVHSQNDAGRRPHAAGKQHRAVAAGGGAAVEGRAGTIVRPVVLDRARRRCRSQCFIVNGPDIDGTAGCGWNRIVVRVQIDPGWAPYAIRADSRSP